MTRKMQENYPYFKSIKPLKPENAKLHKIPITCETFTLGRGLENSVVFTNLAISRKHCTIQKINETDWGVIDNSAFGIHINSIKIKKGVLTKLNHNDIIDLDVTGEFSYKFSYEEDNDNNVFESPKKRMKMDPDSSNTKDIMNNVKLKFDESQNFELLTMEKRIENTKHMQSNSMLLKAQLEKDMAQKLIKLEKDYALQIENLKGEKSEVEKQKAILEKERDNQLEVVKSEMDGKISELMEQIKKHNETEAELLNENNELKQKLEKEREEFLSELNRESSSKQEILLQLEARIKEQEATMAREKEEAEKLRLAKEMQLKELEEQKKLREMELQEQLNQLKKNLEEQLSKTESDKAIAEQELNKRLEEMKKLSEEERSRMEKMLKEKAEAESKLAEARLEAESSLEKLKNEVKEREVQLAALASERIQQQQEQSGEVITSLQQQLDMVKSQLESLQTEKQVSNQPSTTKEDTLAQVGELMESELQCSICSELFMAATTLNCSHTFCKYCIFKWKKKKKECPICRAPITSECKSLVIDSFIEKMVQNLTEEMKQKRVDMLKDRADEERASSGVLPTRSTKTSTANSRRSTTRGRRAAAGTSSLGSGVVATTQTPAQSTGVQIRRTMETVDLTRTPQQPRVYPRRSRRNQAQAPGPVISLLSPVGVVDLASSQALRVLTTGGTAGASAADSEATGRQAVPTDHDYIFILPD